MPNSVKENAPRRTTLSTGWSRGDRPRHCQAVLGGGWWVITWLAQRIPGKLPVENGARGPHPGRPRQSREHGRDGEHPDQEPGWKADADALVNNAAISPKGPGGLCMGTIETAIAGLAVGVPRRDLRARHAGARPDGPVEGRQGLGGERHVHRRIARASLCRCRLRDVEGRAGGRARARWRPTSAPTASA